MSDNYFEETLRFLDQAGSSYIYSMSVQPDKDEYLDMECHKEECKSKFKVNAEDWNNLFKDEAVYCPICGECAPSDEWATTEQLRQLEEQAVNQFTAELNKAIHADVKNFNKEFENNGLLSITMSYDGDTYFENLPANTLEEMKQKNQCDNCGARYAVIGSAFYCPCCGNNSAKQTFHNSIRTVQAKIDHFDEIKTAISTSSKDDAVRICSSILRSCITDLVVSLQVLCECIYPSLPEAEQVRKNVFQRVDDSDMLWKNVCGYGYSDWLSSDDYHSLIRYFQQRHVLQHNDGVVDQTYIDKTGDDSYKVGQRIIINESDVINFSRIIDKIGTEILALA